MGGGDFQLYLLSIVVGGSHEGWRGRGSTRVCFIVWMWDVGGGGELYQLYLLSTVEGWRKGVL